jgi:energy-coupling factor transporter ATP-binding protein EcfA2
MGARALYALLPILAEGAVVVLATTDVDRAADTAARVLLMEAGCVVADGTPAEVLTDPRAVRSGCGTTAAGLALRAGCPPPLPLGVEAAVARYRG